MVPSRNIGVANQEVVFIDQVDEIVCRAWGQVGRDGVVAGKFRRSAEPFFVPAISIRAIDQISANHLCAMQCIGECDYVSVLRMGGYGRGFFGVRSCIAKRRIVVWIARLHFLEDLG